MYGRVLARSWRRPDLRAPINRQHPLARGLLLWWLALPGLAGGKTWYDIGGIPPRNGTLTSMGNANNGWRGPGARPGGMGSVLFDGAAGRVTLAGPTLVNWTLACWVRWGGAATNYQSLILQGGNGQGLYVRATGKLDLFTSGGDHLSTGALAAGAWAHVCLTMLPAGLTFYVNGQPDASTYAIGLTWTPSVVGTDGSGAEQYQGSLDDLRLYGRGLPAAEVAALYRNSAAGCPGLLRRSPGAAAPAAAAPPSRPAAVIGSGIVLRPGASPPGVIAPRPVVRP